MSIIALEILTENPQQRFVDGALAASLKMLCICVILAAVICCPGFLTRAHKGVAKGADGQITPARFCFWPPRGKAAKVVIAKVDKGMKQTLSCLLRQANGQGTVFLCVVYF